MSETISRRQAERLMELMSDPEVAANMTLKQLNASRQVLQEYEKQTLKRRERLISMGLDDDQVAEVETAFHDAPEPNQGAPGITNRNVSGFGEGAIQVVEGVADFAKDLAVGLHNVTGLFEGDNEESRKAFKAAVRENRTARAKANIESFGQLPPQWAEMAGQVFPFLASVPAQAETMLGLIGKRLMQGGAAGASVAQLGGEDMVDRALGGTLGSLLGLFGAVPSSVKASARHGARNFMRRFNSGDPARRQQIEADVRKMTQDERFQFSMSQITGGRFAQGLEVRAAQQATKEQQNRNIEILGNHIFRTAKQMWKDKTTPGKVVSSLRETFKEFREKTLKYAQNQWKEQHDDLITAFGDDIVVRGDDYLAKVDKLVADAEDQLVSMGAKPSKNLRRYREMVDVEVNPMTARMNDKGEWQLFDRKNGEFLPMRSMDRSAVEAVALDTNESFGGLDSDTTLRLIKGLNKAIGGEFKLVNKASEPANRTYARALMGSLTESLESTSGNPEAVKAINLMRENYKEQMALIQTMDDTLVAQVFGGKNAPADASKKLQMVLDSEAADIASTREFLDVHNPELLDEMRALHMQRIVRSSRKATQADVDTPLNLNKFADKLSNEFGGVGQAGKGLHTAAVQADMLRTAKALRVIQNTYFTGVAPGGVLIDDAAINVISRSPEFMARFLTRAIGTGSSMERKMLDREFRDFIQTLANEPVGSSAWNGAMLTGTRLIAENDADKRMKEQAAAKRLVEERSLKAQIGD